MKIYIIPQIVLLFLSSVILGQNIDCNRSVWINRFTKLLPKDICIPNGNYHITEVYNRVDLNEDGLEDFIFDWNRNPLQDGDTIYVTIYLQNPDSSFSNFRTFNNLYPINFKSYSFDYVPKEDKLKDIHKKYYGFDPLIEINFDEGIIKITRKEDAEANLIITYKFDKSINNWRYEKSEEYFLVGGGYKLIDLSEQLGPTIDNFTYFD
jgi:hypothetical protein